MHFTSDFDRLEYIRNGLTGEIAAAIHRGDDRDYLFLKWMRGLLTPVPGTSDLNARHDFQGESPIPTIVSRCFLCISTEARNLYLECLRALLKKVDINAWPSNGETIYDALMQSTAHSTSARIKEVVDLLMDAGIKMDVEISYNVGSWNFLDRLVTRDRYDVVEAIFRHPSIQEDLPEIIQRICADQYDDRTTTVYSGPGVGLIELKWLELFVDLGMDLNGQVVPGREESWTYIDALRARRDLDQTKIDALIRRQVASHALNANTDLHDAGKASKKRIKL